MSGTEIRGTFVWHQLTSADPGMAEAFYGRVFGWKARAWERDPAHTVWMGPRGAVAGLTRPTAEAQPASPPGWLPYVAVADVDAAAAAAERLGGRVLMPAATLPDGGRYAVLADPQSAAIGVFAPPESSARAPASAFSWHELATADGSAAFRFYQELFGWERLADHDLGTMGSYLIFGRGDRQFGGMFNRSAQASGAPRWLLYVEVPSAGEAAQAAAVAGGRITSGPHQVPGGSWVAQLTDSEGAAIAVHQARAAAASRPPPAVGAPSAPAAKARPAAPVSKPASRPSAARRVPARKSARRRKTASKTAARRPAGAQRRGAAVRKRSKTARKSAARRAAVARGAPRKSTRKSRPVKRTPKRAAGRPTARAAVRRPAKRGARRSTRRRGR